MEYKSVLVQILAAKAGVEAKITNMDTFATDGKRILVPEWAQALPTDVLLGFFAHEAVGHIRMTDFGVRSRIPLAGSVLNLLEDIRIERKIPLIFPGARRLLAETAEYASSRFWQAAEQEDPLPLSLFWLMRRLRHDLLGQLGDVLSKKHLARIEAAIPKEWLDKCHKALEIARDALAAAEKTADLLPASETIAQLLAGSAPSAQEHQGNKQATDPNGNHDANHDQGTNRGENKERGDEDLLQRQVNIDLGSLLAEASGKADIAWGVARIQQEDTHYPLKDRTTPEEREAAIRIAAKMRGGLQDALRRVLEDEDERHATSGRFDPRMAASAYKGLARDVFLEEGEEAPGLDARMLLLIDASSSMYPISSAVRAILCGVTEALGTIPEVDLGIAFFNRELVYITEPGASSYALIKAAKSYQTFGSTDWHEATCQSLPWFFKSKSRQKNILFTLTDGDVNMNEFTKALLQKANIECRFLIIGNASYPDWVGNSYPIVRLPETTNAHQVAKGCLKLLRETIIR